MTIEKLFRPPDLAEYWKEKISTTFLEKCMDKDTDMILLISNGGFSYSFWGASEGGSGKLDDQLAAAFRAYKRVEPSADLQSACHGVRHETGAIATQGEDLPRQALLLAEETSLRRSCKFLKVI